MTTTYTTPDINTYPRTLRTTLPKPLWEGECIPANEWETGIFLTAVYWQPRSHRLIIRTYSIWAKPDGTIMGEQFQEVDPSQYGRVAGHDWSIEQELYAAGLKAWILNSI